MRRHTEALEAGVDDPAPHEEGQPPNGDVVPRSGLTQGEFGWYARCSLSKLNGGLLECLPAQAVGADLAQGHGPVPEDTGPPVQLGRTPVIAVIVLIYNLITRRRS